MQWVDDDPDKVAQVVGWLIVNKVEITQKLDNRGAPHLRIGPPGNSVLVNYSDWMIRQPDGSLAIMGSSDFAAGFEAVTVEGKL